MLPIPLLDLSLCRSRQDRVRRTAADLDLDAVLFSHRHYVHALSGYWHRQPLTPVAVLIEAEGRVWLIAPEGSLRSSAADEHVAYVAQKRATIVEHPHGALSEQLYPLLQGHHRIGFARCRLPTPDADIEWIDITRAFQELRRRKDPDELAILRFAIQVTEKIYAEVVRLLPDRPTEVDIHAAMYRTALSLVGEDLSGWGNDFQSGSPGGPPRARSVEEGELAVFDVGVGVRGYRSDLCRTFAVDRKPTSMQSRAQKRIVDVFNQLEPRLAPGASCRDLFNEAYEMLHNWEGLSFTHHLGHGIGLDAHEVPRLNPEWDDSLQVGDVIAVEPALYGDALNAGIRLEQNYLVIEGGAERLSSFPLDL